jgi:hypothetical protein
MPALKEWGQNELPDHILVAPFFTGTKKTRPIAEYSLFGSGDVICAVPTVPTHIRLK